MNVCVPSDYEFQILKPFYLFKLTNEKRRQSLWGFKTFEITWKFPIGVTKLQGHVRTVFDVTLGKHLP